MIKTVLLDLDDTILDFKSCEKLALSRTLQSFSVDYDDKKIERYSAINDGLWKKLEIGEITREELRVHRFEIFLEEIGVSDISSVKFADTYMDRLKDTGVLLPGAIDLLSWLSLNYDLYAVTNGYVDTQMGRINASGIGRYFKGIIISQLVGYDKPSFRFFEYCREKIRFEKAETVLIGDSLTSDIRGAVEYGIYSIWFNPNGKMATVFRPNAEVRMLSEIPALLRSL